MHGILLFAAFACVYVCFALAQPLPAPFSHTAATPDCKNAPLLYPQACGSAPAPEAFSVEFHTTAGNFTVISQVSASSHRALALDAEDQIMSHDYLQRKWGPNGVDRFYNLCALCYFCGGESPAYLVHNNASFFRYVPKFVVQFGISRWSVSLLMFIS
jgi:hypothetical protein